jgi:phenylacetate-CoA ligase
LIPIAPMEVWIAQKIGLGHARTGTNYLKALEDYQIERLNETINHARQNTPFYRSHLADLSSAPLSGLADLSHIPFTYPRDITANPTGLLAVRQDDIARIVTLRTSGSTGESKRVFFTERDLELTVDFFHHGMSTMVRPGQKAMIFLPGERPDSVGDLLARGLERMDVRARIYGPITDPLDAAQAITAFGAHCLVGIPTQILSVARSTLSPALAKSSVESVLLSTDYVPDSIKKILEETWGCQVFNHYGMTETGLGGGVECAALEGYHLREADLFFEIVDHSSGEICPEGALGEVVFTTLTRRGMPLIRYRTGDIGRFIPGSCPCGSVLRRMERVRGRWEGVVPLGHNLTLSLPEIDEVLFPLPGLLDYRATVSPAADGTFRLRISVKMSPDNRLTEGEILLAITKVDAIRQASAQGHLHAPTVIFTDGAGWATTGVAKRALVISKQ